MMDDDLTALKIPKSTAKLKACEQIVVACISLHPWRVLHSYTTNLNLCSRTLNQQIYAQNLKCESINNMQCRPLDLP